MANLAQQGVGIATGIQDSFSWKSLGTAALRSVFVGPSSGDFGADLVGGAIVEALYQGVATATGLQDKFDWIGVATAGVSNAVGAQVRGAFQPARTELGGLGQTLAVGAASAFASGTTRSAIEGSSFGRAVEAGLPNVIAQAIFGGLRLGTEALARSSSTPGPAGSSTSSDETHEVVHGAKAVSDPQIQQPGGQLAGDPAGLNAVTAGQAATRMLILDNQRVAGALDVLNSPEASSLLESIEFVDGLPNFGGEIVTSGAKIETRAFSEDIQIEYRAALASSGTNREIAERIVAIQSAHAPSGQGASLESMVQYVAGVRDGRIAAGPLSYDEEIPVSLTEMLSGTIATNPFGASVIAYTGGGEIAGLLGYGTELDAVKSLNPDAYRAGEIISYATGAKGLIANGLTGGVSILVRNADGTGRSADEILQSFNVTDANLRQQIVDTGFDPQILNDASPETIARFGKLFQGTLDANKAFRGRLGNLSTRARTIETAVDIDRAGLTPLFERQIVLNNGRNRFVDVSAFDPETLRDIRFYQLYRSGPGGSIPLREVNAAKDILNATKIDPTMIRTGP